MNCFLTRSIAGLLGLALAGQALADDWPRFRGPNGTGISTDREIPVRWDESNILWKVAIPGVGNSSPIVWGDRVFLQSASTDYLERLLVCLNANDGEVLWSQSVTGGKSRTHRKNTHASSTPATDGERVYALFWDGDESSLHAYSIDGEPIWKQSLGEFTSQHGPGTSPMIWQDKVIVANDQDGASTLWAFDAKTGSIAWKENRPPFRACYSTPCILEKPGEPDQLIVASSAGITSYNPQSGKANWDWEWEFPGRPLRIVASPVIHQGLVFAQSGDGGGSRHAVAVSIPNGTDQPASKLIWEAKRAFPYVPTTICAGEHIFFIHDKGIAACHHAQTGEQVWTQRLCGEVSASLLLIDGKIYVADELGDVYVFPAAGKFELLAKNSLGEPIQATPAVANHRLFIRGNSHLICIGRK